MAAEIKNIIFDFGGVLVDLDKSRCIESFKSIGFYQAEQLVDTYSQQGVFGKLEAGFITREEFCIQVRQMTGCGVTDEQIWKAWNVLLKGIPTYRLDALLELRNYYHVYLLSNTNAPHWEYARDNQFTYKGHKVEDFFEMLFLSYELNQVKPNEDIFRTVIEKSGIIPEETLFIDDSVANCATARKFGIRTYCPGEGEDWRHLFADVLKK